MAPQSAQPVEVFFSYAHEDEELRDQLAKQLKVLESQGVIRAWHDRCIVAGQKWGDEIDVRLRAADIILLLVSPDFLASDYCRTVEVKCAVERNAAGEACVIPVILRPCQWTQTVLGTFQALPKDGEPVALWQNLDQAFLDVADGISRAIKELHLSRSTRGDKGDEKQELVASDIIPRPPVLGLVSRSDAQGRDIIGRLKENLAPGRNRLITLLGPGGRGKTTLAAEAARELQGAYNGRVVWSGADGRADYTLLSLLDDIAMQLGRPDLRTLPSDAKQERVRALVAALPSLVVLDNYETIAEEEQKSIETWFEKTQCSALFTSRHGIERTLPFSVPVMSSDETKEFLSKLIEQTQDSQIFSAEVRQRICETAEANPYIMQWIVGQIDLAQEPREVLKELQRGEGDAAQRVFERSFDLPRLGDDGRALLLALSLFMPSATREALSVVADFDAEGRINKVVMRFFKGWSAESVSKKRVSKAIKNLSRLWLINGVEGNSRLAIEGLTRNLAVSRMLRDPRAGEFRRRFVAYFLRFAIDHRELTPENYDALERELYNILNAVEIAFNSKDWLSVMSVTEALSPGGMMIFRGYFDEAIKLREQALQAARASQDEHRIAAFLHYIAVVYLNRGDFTKARQLYSESLEIEKRLGDQRAVAIILSQLGEIASGQGEIEEAKRLYDESLEISKRLGDQHGISYVLHEMAMMIGDEGEVDEARRLFNESLEISKRLGDQDSVASTLHNLAALLKDHGEMQEAWQLFNDSLNIQERLSDPGRIAVTLDQLGGIASLQGKIEEARRLYSQSLEIRKKIGDQRGIAISLEDFGKIAQSQGDFREARRLYYEILKIEKKLNDQDGIARGLVRLARLARDEGDKTEAVRLIHEAVTILERIGSPNAEVARGYLDQVENGSPQTEDQ